MGKWKLVEFGDGYSKLYDLSSDIGERTDVASRNAGIVREMREAWSVWSGGMKPAAWPPRYRRLTVNGTELNWEL